jgi:hypothetical protein
MKLSELNRVFVKPVGKKRVREQEKSMLEAQVSKYK